jgi:hypothetical protein
MRVWHAAVWWVELYSGCHATCTLAQLLQCCFISLTLLRSFYIALALPRY